MKAVAVTHGTSTFLIVNFPRKVFQMPLIFTNWKTGRDNKSKINLCFKCKAKKKFKRSLVASTESNSSASFNRKTGVYLFQGVRSAAWFPDCLFHCQLSQADKLSSPKKKWRPHSSESNPTEQLGWGEHAVRNWPRPHQYMSRRCCGKHLPRCSLQPTSYFCSPEQPVGEVQRNEEWCLNVQLFATLSPSLLSLYMSGKLGDQKKRFAFNPDVIYSSVC